MPSAALNDRSFLTVHRSRRATKPRAPWSLLDRVLVRRLEPQARWVFLMDFCGQCRSCRLGFTNQCLQKRGDMGFNRDGGYGQYELIHENIFFPVPDEFSSTEATLLLDIMGTGGHAIDRCRLMRPDIESLLVVGAGPIGLGVLAMAKIILGRQLKVLITDIVSYRVKLAERLGGLPINVRETSLSAGIQSHGLVQVDMAVD